ncbi:MAG TPA: hypothetical protein VFG04_30305 [Planctomycetaceae bacterium]|jgi:WD40 repeat protein|nr:hypothetical protein [Planctomycetaceae bacterium]
MSATLRNSVVRLGSLLVAALATSAQALPADLAPGDPSPVLQIRESGPLTPVNVLGFSPDGSYLYAGGRDKVVNFWHATGGRFDPKPESAFHVPIGAGADGTIESLAVSGSGNWLAVAGRGAKRGLAGERDLTAYVSPAAGMTQDMWLDEGLIYVFDTRTRSPKLLRGHAGAVLALQFVSQEASLPPLLVSAALVPQPGAASIIELKLWDVVKETPIASMRQFPYSNAPATEWKPLSLIDPDFRDESGAAKNRPALPQLAAWRTGADLSTVRVALVQWHSRCGLRVWTPATRQVTFQDRTRAGLPIAAASDPTTPFTVWTTNYDEQTGKASLAAWDVSDTAALRLVQEVSISEPNQVPIALAAFQTDRRYAACLTLDFSAGGPVYPHAVRLLDLGSGTWLSQPIEPHRLSIACLAASSHGQIAVAHNDSKRIETVDVASMNAGGPSAVLVGEGQQFGSVAFVHKQDTEIGLLLRRERPTRYGQRIAEFGAGDVVVDVKGHKLSEEVGGWTLDGVGTDSPSVAVEAQKQALTVKVTRAGQPEQKVTIQCDDSGFNPTLPSAFTIREKSAETPALLIAAVECDHQPFLLVYNLETGERIREFAGHRGRINDLALSRDGRFLASVGSDGTVRVWTLSNWDYLGRRGMLRDGESFLAVSGQAGALSVTSSFGPLRSGDVIQSAGPENSEDRPIGSARELYSLVNKLRPGTTVKLGTQRGPFTLTVGQAIDQRKPLCSLYCVLKKDAEPLWICWHPLGAFDSSSPLAEKYLAWYFNTGDPSMPTRVADVSAYRETYFTRDLLKALFESGKVPPRQAPALPKLTLLFGDGDGKFLDPDEQGEYLIHDANELKEIRLQALGGSSLVHFKSVNWQTLGPNKDEEEHPAKPVATGEWTIDPPTMSARRGRFGIQARLTTDEQPERILSVRAFWRLQPKPPEIHFPDPQGAARVTSRKVQVPVELLTRGEKTRITVTVSDNGGKVRFSENVESSDEKFLFNPQLTLEPGYNHLEWKAAPVEELADAHQEAQVETRNVECVLAPAQITIAMKELVVGDQRIDLAKAPQPIRVKQAALTLVGEIRATQPLRVAEVAVDGRRLPTGSGFAPGTKNERALREAITLEPGQREITLHAEAVDGTKANDTRLRIDYVPALPELSKWSARTLEPSDGYAEDAVVLVEGRNQPKIRIDADVNFGKADTAEPFEIVAVLDDVTKQETLRTFDHPAKHEPWTATLDVPPGRRHKLKLKVANRWGAKAETQTLEIRSLHPPRILSADDLPAELNDLVLPSLHAVIESSGKPVLALRVNGDVLDIKPRVQEAGQNKWDVTIDKVSLKTGINRLELSTSNEDGTCREPIAREMRARGRDPVREIDLLSPRSDQMLTSIDLDSITLHVRAEKPLTQIDVLVNGRTISVPQSVLTALAPGQTSTIPIAVEHPRGKLRYGPNNLIVAKVRDAAGAWADHEWALSCPPAPAVVHIDTLMSRAGQKIALATDLDTSSAHSITPAPDALVTLEGRVEFIRRPDTAEPVQIWVNGFMQELVDLKNDPAGPAAVRAFKASLVLNRKLKNLIEVRYPAPTDDSSSRANLIVDCGRHDASQQLDVVIVAPSGAVNSAEEVHRLRSRILSALAATPLNPAQPEGDYTSNATAFLRIRTHELFGPKATSGFLATVLEHIRHEANRRQQRFLRTGSATPGEAPNGVVFVYFVGKEQQTVPDGADHRKFILLTRPVSGPVALSRRGGDNIDSDFLSTRMGRLRGAHLLFLDVQDLDVAGAVSRWPDDPHLGVFRTVWKVNATPSDPLLLAAFERANPAKTRVLRDLEQRIQEVLQLPQMRGMLAADLDSRLPAALAELPFSNP